MESGSDKLFAGANQAVSDAFSSIRVIHAYNLRGSVRGYGGLGEGPAGPGFI